MPTAIEPTRPSSERFRPRFSMRAENAPTWQAEDSALPPATRLEMPCKWVWDSSSQGNARWECESLYQSVRGKLHAELRPGPRRFPVIYRYAEDTRAVRRDAGLAGQVKIRR